MRRRQGKNDFSFQAPVSRKEPHQYKDKFDGKIKVERLYYLI